MIANRDLHSELDEIDKVLTQLKKDGQLVEWAKLKTATLNTKLLSNLRTNMVTTMIHLNVPMKKGGEKVEPK